ncbi:methyltransferase domain-containing protein [Anaerolineales bacterium HSG6]|nr:methyltransferase domain-containing protein [Anaerolineales bacterium HSG6]
MTTQNKFLFWQQFQKNFFHVGAVLPSSAALGKAATFYLSEKKENIKVLEAGAGTGSFTREILPFLDAGDSLDAVEINPDLIRHLYLRFQSEPDFQVANGVDVNLINADLLQFPFNKQYDYIIFSLPMTNFPSQMVEEVLTLMMKYLKPGGVFSYVKYIFIGQVKYMYSRSETKANMKNTQEIIKRFADQYQFDRKVVGANVPPTWVHYWRKPIQDTSESDTVEE